MTEAIEYRKGDRVWVEGFVVYDAKLDSSGVSVNVNGTVCYPSIEQVELIQQFFMKGDPCIYMDGLCTVVWVDGTSAWIKSEDGNDWVVDAGEIRRPVKNVGEGEAKGQ